MARSGVTISSEITEVFNDLKLKHKLRYIILKIVDQKQIVIEETAGVEATFDDLKCKLPPKEGRYVIYDMDLVIQDKNLGNEVSSRKGSSIIFLVWIPDNAKVPEKMLMASSKDDLKKNLTGVNIEIQANDMGDLDENEVIGRCVSMKR